MCDNCNVYNKLLQRIQLELKHELDSLTSNTNCCKNNNNIYLNEQLFADAIQIARHKEIKRGLH